MTDVCPNCPWRGAEPIEPVVERRQGDQLSSLYRCPRCGHVWSTNRDVRFYGREAA